MNSRLSSSDKIQEAYEKLKNEIIARQENEKQNDSLKPKTDANYKDAFQYALIHYAVLLNDSNKIQDCLKMGADINLKKSDPGKILSLSHLSPIAQALQNDLQSSAQYLYDNGAACHSLYLPHAKSQKTKEWIQSQIKKELDQFKITYQSVQNVKDLKQQHALFKFLSAPKEMNQIEQIIIRMIEVGDFDYLKKLFAQSQENEDLKKVIDELKLKNNQGVDFPFSYSLMQAAVASGSIEIVEYLIGVGFKMISENPYKTCPIQMAIINGDIHYTKMLIQKMVPKHECNYQDRLGNTILIYAVMSNQIELVKFILDQGADIKIKNIDGNTVLHFAAKIKNHEMLKFLKEEFQKKDNFVNEKNIYGHTFEEISLEDNLAPINQMTIMARLDYYCRKNYKSELTYLPACTAFDDMFLFHGLSKCTKSSCEDLRCISEWSGDETELEKKAAGGFVLREVLESWCRDIKKHNDRPELIREGYQSEYKISFSKFFVEKPIKSYLLENQPVFVFSEWRDSFPFSGVKNNKSKEQLEELLNYLFKMPFGMHIKLDGDAHASGISLNQLEFKYYDPNHLYESALERDPKLTSENIIQYKYIRQNHFDTLACPMYCFYSMKDFINLDFNQPVILDANEIPSDKNQADEFQKKSPNGFTPLHVAILTRQTKLLDRLLKDGFCDTNALDASGRSPVVMAILSHSEQMVLKLVPHLSIHSAALAIKAAYHHESIYFPRQKQICMAILKNVDLTKILLDDMNELRKMLIPAISDNDFDMIKQLIDANKKIFDVNHNWPESRVWFPLSNAVLLKKSEIAIALLDAGADFFKRDPFPPNNRCSFEIILNSSQYSDKIFSKMCHIMKEKNLINEFHNDFLPIEMGIKNQNVTACEQLIGVGADLLLKNRKGQSVIECLQQSLQAENTSSSWVEFVNKITSNYSIMHKKN